MEDSSRLSWQIQTKPQLGANLASFLPYILFGQVAETTGALRAMGYDFVSVLPTRNTINANTGEVSSVLPIWYIEKAWNPTDAAHLAGLMEVVRGKLTHNVHAPQLHDLVAFPDKQTAEKIFVKAVQENPQAHVVTHNLLDALYPLQDSSGNVRTLIEVNPGMTDVRGNALSLYTLRRELDEAHNDDVNPLSGVVFDTHHARRTIRKDELPSISAPGSTTRTLGGWDRVLRVMGSDIKLIDFQAKNQAELQDTLNHGNTELAEIVRTLAAQYPQVPVRMEIQLSLKDQLVPGRVLSVMEEATDFLRETYSKRAH